MMRAKNIKKIIFYFIVLIAALFVMASLATLLLSWYYKF